MKKISRRHFLRSSAMVTASGAIALGFSGCSRLLTESAPSPLTANRYGDFLPDPYGILDLPEGFTYHAFSTVGERMADGLLVPGGHDGMGAFPAPNGKTILIRNHELGTGPQTAQSFAHDKRLREIDPEKIYDPGKGTKPGLGGTTTVVYDTKTRTVVWVDIQNIESPKDDLRFQGFNKGAAKFARGEGMWYSGNTIYFVCTNGGYRKICAYSHATEKNPIDYRSQVYSKLSQTLSRNVIGI